MTMTSTNPYADAYDAYWAAGWRGVLPLPYRKKTHPPTGYTGRNAAEPSYADCAADRLGLIRKRVGYPAASWWMTPEEAANSADDGASASQRTVRAPVRGESLTTLTTPTEAQLEQLEQSEQPPARLLQPGSGEGPF